MVICSWSPLIDRSDLRAVGYPNRQYARVMSGQPHVPAVYDPVADWYADYVVGKAGEFTARAGTALREVLGRGQGVCWDLACGTGIYADTIRELGWTPFGTDVSMAQVRHAVQRMPAAVADAIRPPLRLGSVAAVASVLCHTDIDDYPAVCRAAMLVLAPGGRFAHVGIHPCFIGAFADRSDPQTIRIEPGYWRRERRFDGWGSGGIRRQVGALHLPLSDLVDAITSAGLTLDKIVEFGEPTPDVLAIRAHRPLPTRAPAVAGPADSR